MGGAYVAIPEPAVVVDVPPGWLLTWPFPGPLPPGYEPEYALDLTAPATMIPGVPVGNIHLTLTDHEEYPTVEPDNETDDTTIIWSAAWKDTGAMVKLRIVDTGPYTENVIEPYSLIGVYWGAEPTFEFDVHPSDDGRTVVLTAESTPFADYPVEQTADIIIVITPPGFTVYPTIRSTWIDGGFPTSSFTVVLNSVPSTTVIITILSTDTDEGTVSPGILTFTTSNWNVPQTVVITAVAIRGHETSDYLIWATPSSSDLNYNSLAPKSVTVTNIEVPNCVPCEFGAVANFNLLSTIPARWDYSCLEPCVEPCRAGGTYCHFMDWAPSINNLQVGTTIGWSNWYWRVSRYNVITHDRSFVGCFFSASSGIISCDGKIVANIDTSGNNGMGLPEPENFVLELWVGCGTCSGLPPGSAFGQIEASCA